MALKDLSAVTSAKFGTAGMKALANYPQLTGALIDENHYMKEEGTARPASTFAIVRSSDNRTVAKGITGSQTVRVGGAVVYQPVGDQAGGGMDQKTMLMIGGGVVGIILLVLLLKPRPYMPPPRGGGYGGGRGGGYGGGRGRGYGDRYDSYKRWRK